MQRLFYIEHKITKKMHPFEGAFLVGKLYEFIISIFTSLMMADRDVHIFLKNAYYNFNILI